MADATVKFPKIIVNHYIATLKRKIKVDGVLLFGSFAWGNPTKHSDVDLVVISKDFSKYDFDERLSLLNHTRDKISYQLFMVMYGGVSVCNITYFIEFVNSAFLPKT